MSIDFLTQEQEGAGGAYRIIGLMTFTPGYKVYAADMSQEESFFPYVEDDSKRAARQKAIAFKAKTGAQGDVRRHYVFIVPKDTCFAGGDNWNVDQYFFRTVWHEQIRNAGTSDEADDRIVFNSVKDHVKDKRVNLGAPFYGALRLVPDPYYLRQGEAGKIRKVTLQDGTEGERWPSIAVLDVVYATEEEAKDAAAQFVVESDPNVPPGWEKGVWELTYDDIKAKFAELKAGGMPEAAAVTSIAKGTYGLDDVKYVEMVLGIDVPI